MTAQTELCWLGPIRPECSWHYAGDITDFKKKSSIPKFSCGGGIQCKCVCVCVHLCPVGEGSLIQCALHTATPAHKINPAHIYLHLQEKKSTIGKYLNISTFICDLHGF